MNIKLGHDYLVKVDTYNFTLYKEKKLVGYFQSMKSVLERIILEESRPEVEETMEEFLKRYKEIETRLNEVVKDLIIDNDLTKKGLGYRE